MPDDPPPSTDPDPDVATRQRWLWVLLPLLVMPGLTWLLYHQTLDYSFQYDDIWNLVKNERLHMGNLDTGSLLRAARGERRSTMRPISNLGFALTYYVAGLQPRAFRLVNIVIHALNGILVFLFLRKTLSLAAGEKERAPPATPMIPLLALCLAVVWLVHPLHTSAVTYIHQRMCSQASGLYLLALLAFLTARSTPSLRTRRAAWAGCVVAGLLAIGSKEIALTLPLAIALCEWCLFQRCDPHWFRRHKGKLLASLAAIAGAGLLAMFWYGKVWLLGYSGSWQIPLVRMMTEFRVLVYYLWLLVYPHPSLLNVDHDIALSNSLLDPPSTLFSLLALLALLGLIFVVAKKRRPLACLLLCWYFLHNALEFAVPALDLVAEYRMYLASLAALWLIALLLRPLPRRGQAALCLALLVVAVPFSLWTRQRNTVWENPETLWRDSLAKSPQSYRAHFNIATELMNHGLFEEAFEHLQAALRTGERWELYNRIATCLHALGRPEEAAAALQRSEELSPDAGFVRYRHAENLRRGGQLRAALQVVAADSNTLQARVLIGQLHADLGETTQALYHFRRAVEQHPGSAKAHASVGNLYAQREAWPEAAEFYGRAVQIDPQNTTYRYDLGLVHLRAGHGKRAVHTLQALLAMTAEDALVWYSLGRAHALAGDAGEAERHYQRAVALDPSFREAWDVLGSLLYQRGAFRQAAEAFAGSLDCEVRLETRLRLGTCLLAAGEDMRGLAQLQQVLGVEPDHSVAHELMGLYYAQNGAYTTAIHHLRRALRGRPDDPNLKAWIAKCREKLGQE